MVKNLFWFAYGLIAIVGFATINIYRLTLITLRDGHRPYFGLEQKRAEGKDVVVVNDYTGGQKVVVL